MSAIVGETLVFGQENGQDVRLVVYGDEFYARYETVDGHSVYYDLRCGCYCYVELDSDGRFVSTGTPVWKRPPMGVPKHLKESGTVRNEKFKSAYDRFRPQEPVDESAVLRTLGPNNGLLTGRQVNIGDVRGLTILVEFQDVRTQISAEDVTAMLNEPDYLANGNFCSVNRYYHLMSNGKLNYTNEVVGPVRLSQKQSYYINTPLMSEALQAAIDEFDVDLSRYDSLGKGIVDALSLLYAGRTLYKNELWPHNSVMNFTHRGTRTHYYTIQSLGRSVVDLSIGTFTHESGHMLCRFPDLYDYGERDGDFEDSAGLGRYCLMSSGNHLDFGKTPSPISAYLRDLAGWCDVVVRLDQAGTYQARHGEYGTVMKYPTDKMNEYFLVENRSNMGLDGYLPDGGLAVYHCDTRGSNEWEDGTPDRHYQCALLQADGRWDLENGTNSGDSGDLLDGVQGMALSDTTTPSSRTWSGADSGLVIRDIGVQAEEIVFATGAGDDATVEVSERADQIIPDDDPAGITRILHVDRTGMLQDIRVTVDIVHSFRGDLLVELESPGGTKVVLHKKKYDPADNLHLELSSAADTVLQELRGEAIEGDWKLHVKDLWRDDRGRLDNWALAIDFVSEQEVVSQTREPGLAIPDDDPTGAHSSIQVALTGTVADVEVAVAVTHPYRGDLQVELVAPSGNVAVLRAPDWRNGVDLAETYTMVNTEALRALVGHGATGDWTLRIRDLAAWDTGTFESWTLKLVIG